METPVQKELRFVEESDPTCRVCGSKDYVKANRTINVKALESRQIYKCNRCGCYWTAGIFAPHMKTRAEIVVLGIALARAGFLPIEIVRELKTQYNVTITTHTVSTWAKKFSGITFGKGRSRRRQLYRTLKMEIMTLHRQVRRLEKTTTKLEREIRSVETESKRKLPRRGQIGI